MEDDVGRRIADALERVADQPPVHARKDLSPAEMQQAQHRLLAEPQSPFRSAQERKRTYLAREDGRRPRP